MNKFVFFIFLIIFITGCKEKPTNPDREGKIQMIVIDTSSALEIDPVTNLRILKNSEIVFNAIDYNTSFKFFTNNQGIVIASGLPGSNYAISVHVQVNDNMAIYGIKNIDIYSLIPSMDTLYLKGVPSSPIIINEVYLCGPVNNKNYVWDVFVELYNNTDEIQYLDGIIICRGANKRDPATDPGMYDLGNNVVGVRVISAFQFPGNPGEKNYPIHPGQIVVIACDAIDHRTVIPASYDLSPTNPVFPQNPALENSTTSKAQLWEFYNSVGTDVDAPNVPNVNNIIPGKTQDFLLGMTGDAVVAFSGKKGIIYSGEDTFIDLTTVIDGVQYNSDVNTSKKVDGRIDGGCAGVGIPKYSGKSTERKADPNNPKKHFDTNNSFLDFGVNEVATPGYQGNPK